MKYQYLYVTLDDDLPSVRELPIGGPKVENRNEALRPRDDLIRGVYEWNSQEEDKSLNTIHIVG